LLQQERTKSIGILNGIDNEVWNPETDSMLSQNYSVDDFEIGKQKNKELLCQQYHLDSTKPLFAFIGRLVTDKGADLLAHICSIAFIEHAKEINILILGSGDSQIEKTLETIKPFFSGNYNAVIGYNESLAHLIYSGTDFLLMPSRVEPCGLNQLYSMRYGTIPIVRRTGGLRDTVIDLDENGYGICHEQATVSDVIHSIVRAVDLFKNQEKFNELIKENMKIDHSWGKVAGQYINIYESLTVRI
jgi:starch synthase